MGMTVNGFDDVIKMLDKYSKKTEMDAVAKKAVDAAKGKIEASMKGALAASENDVKRGNGVHHSKDPGLASRSVQATETKTNSYGVYSVARPTGRDSQGTRNTAKAAHLENGTPTLAARPWRQKAVSGAENECIKIMEDIVASELGAE